MSEVSVEIAKNLLQINAIKLSPSNPFTWASGWNSPIYCDNRKTLSYPETRKLICKSFAKLIEKQYPDVDIIAGVATGAIAHGVLVAEEMGKPFIYIRSSPKSHGLTNQIEGECPKGAKVVVVEDLVSTGGSSLSAVEALRGAGCRVMGMVAIFTYGFDEAAKNFAKAGVELTTLSNYGTLIATAIECGYVKQQEMETLNEWRESPSTWRK